MAYTSAIAEQSADVHDVGKQFNVYDTEHILLRISFASLPFTMRTCEHISQIQICTNNSNCTLGGLSVYLGTDQLHYGIFSVCNR